MSKREIVLGLALAVYLLVIGGGAAFEVIVNFPTEKGDAIVFPHGRADTPAFLPFGNLSSPDEGLILLATLAGIAGSFLSAAQSLASYLGNKSFKESWAVWYVFRPFIGGLLGFAIYITFRAGLIAGAGTMSPSGVVMLGLLGGWFSKTTSDKLQEVFETLFKTDEDRKRNDKLQAAVPLVEAIEPSPVAAQDNQIRLLGRNFMNGATVLVGGQDLAATFVSDTELTFSLPAAARPATGAQIPVRVKNPEGPEPLSAARTVLFN